MSRADKQGAAVWGVWAYAGGYQRRLVACGGQGMCERLAAVLNRRGEHAWAERLRRLAARG